RDWARVNTQPRYGACCRFKDDAHRATLAHLCGIAGYRTVNLVDGATRERHAHEGATVPAHSVTRCKCELHAAIRCVGDALSERLCLQGSCGEERASDNGGPGASKSSGRCHVRLPVDEVLQEFVCARIILCLRSQCADGLRAQTRICAISCDCNQPVDG